MWLAGYEGFFGRRLVLAADVASAIMVLSVIVIIVAVSISYHCVPFSSLFSCLSFPLRIDPLHFQAGSRKRHSNPDFFLVVLVYFML